MTGDDLIQIQLQQTIERYRERFGSKPAWAAVAPGRVNLIGEHTDYNDGFVMPMAITRQTVIVAGLAQDPARILLTSTSQDDAAVFDLKAKLTPGHPTWANYVKGVVAGCIDKGLTPIGFQAVIDSTVPLGGGLSSSASLEVAAATLIEAITGQTLDGVTKALLCQQAEHVFAGTPCGIMDQFISTLGQADHAMLLDCRSHETRMVPMTDPSIAVLIINSNVRHNLASGEYAERRAQCEAASRTLGVKALRDATLDQLMASQDKLDDVTFRRARHVISEINRTTTAANVAAQNQWQRFGELMYDSHRSLSQDFEVSCEELDLLVELAGNIGIAGGVYGSRMTGGGFGGCTVSIVQADNAQHIQDAITRDYKNRTGIDPIAFVTQAAQGARILPL